jgi:hypothetical protein
VFGRVSPTLEEAHERSFIIMRDVFMHREDVAKFWSDIGVKTMFLYKFKSTTFGNGFY